MKRFFCFLSCFFLICALFSGCQNKEISSMSSDSLEEKEKILTVYYIDGFNTLARIGLFRTQHPEVTLQAVKFETCQELEDELIKNLNTNTGPDVVIFDELSSNTWSIDFQKTALSGAFLPLDEYLSQDETYDPQAYLASAMEGSKIDGKQYFLPFAVRLVTAFQPTNFMQEKNIVQGQTSWEEYFTAVNEAAKEVNADPAHYATGIMYHSSYQAGFDYIDFLQSSACLNLVQRKDGRTEIEDGNLRQIVDVAKTMYQSDQNFASIPQGEDIFPEISIYNMMHPLPRTIYDRPYYAQSFETNTDFFIPPTMEDPSRYSALISYFGAVTKDAKNPDLGYQLLRTCMDYSDVSNLVYNPVKRESFAALREWMESSSVRSSGNGVDYVELTEEQGQAIQQIYDNIAYCQISNPKVTQMIKQEFQPYFEDTNTYENCLATFQGKLRLYLEE